MAVYSFGIKRSRRFKEYHFKSEITTRGLVLRTSGRTPRLLANSANPPLQEEAVLLGRIGFCGTASYRSLTFFR
jgi:hypothetical protein